MRLELFVAARYLRAKRRQAVVGIITTISVVGVADLTRITQNIVARNMQPMLWYPLAAVIYLMVNLALATAAQRMELRLRRGMARVTL